MHSLAEDEAGNIWMTQYGFTTDPRYESSVGFLRADRSGIVMFPSPSLYADSSDSCWDGTFTGFSGSGITVNKQNGDVWFTDYCRRRIGRIREVCE
jgi:streptogramin lyase